MKKKIAIIGASYLQVPLIEKAKEIGCETHVFAWGVGDVGEMIADYFYPISITETETILVKCQEIGIDAITSISSDLAVRTVNYIANRMGLVGNSIDCTNKTCNKYKMRLAFKENGDPAPRFDVANNGSYELDDTMRFPLIIKPTDRSGSRGVTKVYNKSEVKKAIENSISESFESRAIIEEYVHGKEYSIEGISYQGSHRILAYTEKFTTGEPHFIEIGHKEPADLDFEVQRKIDAVVFHALDSLDIKNGASHSEVKVDELGNVHIIEIGARMGGDLIGSDLVRCSTGIDYVRAVVDIALGNKPNLNPIFDVISPVACRFIISNKDFEEYMDMMNTSPERIIRGININPESIGDFRDSSERNAGVYVFKMA